MSPCLAALDTEIQKIVRPKKMSSHKAISRAQSAHVRGHPDLRRRFVAVDPVPNWG
jgi:hypothetical protein